MDVKTITRSDILKRLDAITGGHAYLKEAFDALEKIQPAGPEDTLGQARVEAVVAIAREREETNRRAIDLLEALLEQEPPEAAEEE